MARYGSSGQRLYRFARGEDARDVYPDAPAQSISAETTFEHDIAAATELLEQLWPLCEKVARRLKKAALAGCAGHLKLKTSAFKLVSPPPRRPGPTPIARDPSPPAPPP